MNKSLLKAVGVALAVLGWGGTADCVENDPSLFAVNVLMNSGFEDVADSTTEPPKRGAYWRGAFVHEKGNPSDRVVEYAAGKHGLLLALDAQTRAATRVSQIVTLYGPAAKRFELTLRVRFEGLDSLLESGDAAVGDVGASRLIVGVVSQGARSIRYRIGGDDAASDPSDARVVVPASGEPDAEGFYTFRLPVGEDMTRITGAPPEPWNRITLSTTDGPVLVDDVYAPHLLPRIEPRELREFLLEDVRRMLKVFLGKPNTPIEGLELVDRRSGYADAGSYNVATGMVMGRSNVGVKTGIHNIMLNYLRVDDDLREHQPLRLLVRKVLRAHLKSMLTNNIYEPTGLYCLFNRDTEAPILDAPMVMTDFIHYVLDATELPFAEFKGLREKAIERVVAMADKMVEIRAQHDLPEDQPFGRGPRGNWFGRMPEKLTPEGGLDQPLKNVGTYDQAWAIKSNRSWYHDFDSAEGIARVHGVFPKDSYVAAIDRVLELFDRVFDAERYDLENDTDDHYGMNVEALLRGFRTGGYRLPQMRDFAQTMTDYRLPRDVPWHENLWVEGIRLGSFTTGDQPRAYRGPVWLWSIPAAHNPVSSQWRGYEYAIRELAKSDLKRRLLDDGYMTEASSYQWEMISACYSGNYIGPCSERPRNEWEGDMGDQFAGPAANSFRCLGRTLELCRKGPNREFLAWYYLVQAHTQEMYERPYGYRFGMPVETGRRYGIPERELKGWSDVNPSMLSSTWVHSETLASLDLDYDAPGVRITEVKRDESSGKVRVAVKGPAGRTVRVAVSDRVVYSEVGVTDYRLRFTPTDSVAHELVVDASGWGVIEFDLPDVEYVAVDAFLGTVDGEDVDDLASGEYLL